MRAQVYLEMEKQVSSSINKPKEPKTFSFRCAYIDATEALKLNGSIEEDKKLTVADRVQTHCIKAHALAALGFADRAAVEREVAERAANQCDDEELKDRFQTYLQKVSNVVSSMPHRHRFSTQVKYVSTSLMTLSNTRFRNNHFHRTF